MSRRIYLYGTVLHDRGKYRMWYFCRMGPHWRFAGGNHQIPGLYMPRSDEKPYHYHGATADRYGRAFVDNDRGDLTCYAESDDGIHWRKPELGIFTFDGRADNNIVWNLHGASVFVDRDEPDPRRRYRNIFLLCSADGIRWDDRDKRRIICYSESPVLAGPWKDAVPIFEPRHWDDEIGRRKYGALRAEFHNMSAFRYNNLYLGLLGVLYVTAEQDPDDPYQMPCDGPIDAQWAYSRDGINWQHADRARTSAIPRGAGDAFDRGMIIGTCKEPVVVGDEVHWYYSGAENTHGGKLEYWVKRIGRATWRRDRFVALAGTGEVDSGGAGADGRAAVAGQCRCACRAVAGGVPRC